MNPDQEFEDEILASYERGEWRLVPNQRLEIARLKAAARETMLRNKRVSVRMSALDLERLRAKAVEEGIPYQTLMWSVLHKYVSGRLVEATLPGRKAGSRRKVSK